MTYTAVVVWWSHTDRSCEIREVFTTEDKKEHDIFVLGAKAGCRGSSDAYCLGNDSLLERIWQYYKFPKDKHYHNGAVKDLIDFFPEIAKKMKQEVENG